MRARRREINIFNMSLLDILCGALGAFCFMMIVALPYYIPPGKARDLRKSQEETEKLMRDLEKMKERLPDQKSVEEMEAMLKRLEAQVKALQGQVNILTAEKEDLQRKVNQLTNEKTELQQRVNQLTAERDQLAQQKQELQAKNHELEEENKKLKASMPGRPFSIVMRTDDYSQGLDVMLFKSTITEDKQSPLFNSWVQGRFDDMHRVRDGMLFGRGLVFSIFAGPTSAGEGKIFVRLTDPPERRKTTQVEGAIVADEMITPPVRLPRATLYPERFWILLGTVTFDQNSIFQFNEATEAEREAAWQALTGSTPPPTPTPTPTPTDAERAAAEADRAKYEANRIRLREAHQKFSKLVRIPMDDTGKNDAEILQLADEILKDLPPRDGMRREVESLRNHVLEMKARREGRPPPSPNESASPSPRGPAPIPGP